MEQFLKIEEVANKLNVHTNTIRNWLRDGRFPNFLQVGKAIRIPVSDIQALQNQHKEAANG